MTAISIKDIFKIGIGPSSSHTMGPWRSALDFLAGLKRQAILNEVVRLKIYLWNSLAKTGLGHGSDIGLLLGLEGENFETIDPTTINEHIEKIKRERKIYLLGQWEIYFSLKEHLIFETELTKDKHPNQIDFEVKLKNGSLLKESYFSVGGGFIEKATSGEEREGNILKNFPFPIEKADEILKYHQKTKYPFDKIVLANELSYLSEQEVNIYIEKILKTMIDSIYQGCHSEGVLPGGLNVNRRASNLNKKLLKGKSYSNLKEWLTLLQKEDRDFRNIIKFVSCFALAVNEINADMGKIVTSPTNGAAGVIPAVFMYYYCFVKPTMDAKEKRSFFLVASEIGSLFKKNASISAASGGCQAEIGVSSSMAAAGLTHILGGTIEQTLMAAEIAMEHHLGLTCDPIKGLVQIPCIERNSMGAIKAITASELAINSNPKKAIVKLDDVIKTMWDTAKDMSSKYKETAEGGLAINIPINIVEC